LKIAEAIFGDEVDSLRESVHAPTGPSLRQKPKIRSWAKPPNSG